VWRNKDCADLSLSKTASPAAAPCRAATTYTLAFSNAGKTRATSDLGCGIAYGAKARMVQKPHPCGVEGNKDDERRA
jgi:hypothetical protein